AAIASAQSEDPLVHWARWFLADRATRTISPFSQRTMTSKVAANVGTSLPVPITPAAVTLVPTPPHPSLTTPHLSVERSGENDYAEAMKLATGLGKTRIDLSKAAEYLQRAAAKNVPEAEARLAYWINNGLGGLAKDNVKAEQWGKKALE